MIGQTISVLKTTATCCVLLLLFSCLGDARFDESMQEQHEIDVINQQIKAQCKDEAKCLFTADSLFWVCKDLGYEVGMFEAVVNINKLSFMRHDFHNLIQHYAAYREALLAIRSPELRPAINFELGEIELFLNDAPKSLEYYLKAAEYFEQQHKTSELAKVWSRLGILQIDEHDYQKAGTHLKKSIELSTAIFDSVSMARDLHNLSVVAINLRNFGEAKQHLERAALINRRTKRHDYLSQNLCNLGYIENVLGDYKPAIKYCKEAIQVSKSSAFVFSESMAWRNLADVYISQEKFDSAQLCLELATERSRFTKTLRTEIDIHETLFGLLQAQNKHEAALSSFMALTALRDSMEQKRTERWALTVQSKLEIERTANEAELQAYQRSIRLRVLIFGLVSLLFVLIYFFRRRQLKSKARQDVLQTKLHSKQREILSYITNEIRLTESKTEVANYLKEQQKEIANKTAHAVIGQSIRKLLADDKKQLWKELDIRFNQVNPDFYARLLKKHPDITKNEKRLCAFLLMNMSSKEIASLTGQSLKALEQARTRLRKKLGLNHTATSLSNFLKLI